MKPIKIAFVLLAVFFAITTAFTSKDLAKTKDSTTTCTLIWFLVHPTTGVALDPNYGRPGVNPFGCDQVQDILCARALCVEDQDVEMVSSDPLIYKIAAGIDITSSAYYDGTIRKSE